MQAIETAMEELARLATGSIRDAMLMRAIAGRFKAPCCAATRIEAKQGLDTMFDRSGARLASRSKFSANGARRRAGQILWPLGQSVRAEPLEARGPSLRWLRRCWRRTGSTRPSSISSARRRRATSTIQLIFLNLPFESAATLAPGGIALWCRVRATGSPPRRDRSTRHEFETTRTVFDLRYGAFERWEAGIERRSSRASAASSIPPSTGSALRPREPRARVVSG
jgi:hypothetical protein